MGLGGCGQAGDDHLEARAVGGHPRAGEELAPVQAIDRREQIGRAFDERHQRAHRQRHAAFGEVAPDAVQRGEQHELLIDEPGQPLREALQTFGWLPD